ncbi:MAG: AGCS family alanine or glycine:cation symporter, partial [Myxococcota bacterium]
MGHIRAALQRLTAATLALGLPGVALAQQGAAAESIVAQIDAAFGAYVVGPLFTVMFFDITFGLIEGTSVPAVVAWLVMGAVFFTLRMQFIGVRAFGHALRVVSGQYDDEDDDGEISHFQALSSALSATVGLGNIAGVAIAITTGGPGAIFWMVLAGLLGMSSKFVECTLGQMYRVVRPDGSVSGGPMHYLSVGLAERGLGPLGRVLSVLFALMCIGGSLGGGNMFQANQSYAAVKAIVPVLDSAVGSVVYGVVLAFLVGLVIIGGIKRIGAAAGLIVPLMCGLYVLAGLFILVVNASAVPAAFGAIVSQAFTPEAGFG